MNKKGLVILPAEQPVTSTTPGRSFSLKLRTEQTAGSVIVFEEVAPPGTTTSFHLHHDSDEVMCILTGEFTFKIGDRVAAGGPGTCAFMPRGIAHAWKNSGGEEGRALFIYTPAGAGSVF
jgi:mannose-6-phosphate isomerase-like protein (cupin superfamily)